ARHLAEVPLSVASMELWERIGDLLDDDCGFESHGQVLVAESEAELDQFRARVTELRLQGYTHEELIDRAELKRLIPAVSDACPGGVVSRRDGAADPFRTTQAFRRKAIALGATVLEGVRVTGLERRAGMWRVSSSVGAFAAPVVVHAGHGHGRRRRGRPHRRQPRRARTARGYGTHVDDHRPRAEVHRAGGDPQRPQALLQAARQWHGADWRRTSGPV